MIFVDHMNFDIALQDYYKKLGQPTAKLDYNKLFHNITQLVDNVDFVKATIFVPEPDDFLKTDPKLSSYYKWATGLGKAPFVDVISGRYCARPIDATIPMDINKRNTYYKVEKGTDINLAVDAINKAFHNSYDVAYIVSADTDYMKVYDVLKSYGKLVVVIVVDGQSTFRVKPNVDAVFTLDDAFFSTCLRPSVPTVTTTGTITAPCTTPDPTITAAAITPATTATPSAATSSVTSATPTTTTTTSSTGTSAGTP